MIKFVVAVVVGALFGLAGPHYLFLGWFSLIPWGIAGLALGYWSERRERFWGPALRVCALLLIYDRWIHRQRIAGESFAVLRARRCVWGAVWTWADAGGAPFAVEA